MRYFLTLVVLLCSIYSFSQKKAIDPFVKLQPVPHKAVNDFDKFLKASERDSLEKELANYRAETGNSIVFISLDSLTSRRTKKQYTIEEAALLYFNTWGIGDSIKNNGVLLMVSRKPRRVRIEVGKGIDDILTNSICKTIIDDKLTPSFKQGSFYLGIKEALSDIKNTLDNPPAPEAATPAESNNTVEYGASQSINDWSGLVFGIGLLIAIATFGAIGYFILKGLVESKTNTGAGNRPASSKFFRGSNNVTSADGSPIHRSDNNNDWSSSNDNAIASFSSFDSSPSSSDSSSSASSDSSSSGGGSSNGGGASGDY
jgi:uncharacterized protein